MPVESESANHGLVVAALFALLTDWDKAETRQGRRGEFRTTGANMYRIRELQPEETEQIKMLAATFGIDTDEEDLQEMFSGEYEYQISYACNRFATKSGKYAQGPRLTSQELRTLERAKQILAQKEGAATQFLTTPNRDKAA